MKFVINYLSKLFAKNNPQVNEYPIIQSGFGLGLEFNSLGSVLIVACLLIISNPEEFDRILGNFIYAPVDFWEYIKSTPESLIGMSADEIDALNDPEKKHE